MIAREQLISEIQRMDAQYLDLAFKIICQFPHSVTKADIKQQKVSDILQNIANNGGLGIDDPIKWQREIRQDRVLPYRKD